jgi:tetratricopeptide (TPR) repeat protein
MKNKNEILNEFQIITNNFQSGNFIETISKSKKLLHILPNNEFLNNMIGMSYTNIGELEKAKNLYLKMIKINPAIISFQNNYANVLKAENKIDEAEKVLERILERKPDYINALNNLANLKTTLEKYGEAIKLFEHALSLEPENSTMLYNIALCYRSLRDLEKVKEYALKITELDPNFTLADRIISEIQDYSQDNIGHYEVMEKKLTNKEIEDKNKITLLFSLAKANEDKKNYEQSFKFLKKANDLRKKENPYNLNSDIEEFNKIKKIFNNTELPYIKNENLNKKIIFICGIPRSGTTLVEQIVSAHSEVKSLGETDQVQSLISKTFENFTLSIDNVLQNNNFDQSFIYEKFINFVNKIENKMSIFTDKSLLNFKLIGFIKFFFPNSKIIVLKRDINNNLLSIYKNDLTAKNLGWTYDIKQINDYYKIFNNYLNLWNDSLKNPFFEVNYSDLINEPSKISKEIISYCDLKWENNCLEYYRINNSAIDTASANQANKPIYSSSLNKFENFKKFFNLG